VRRRTRLGRLRVLLSGAVAALLGAAPHVLHHAGPLAGAALLGGVMGSLLFGALGLVAAIPFLLRIRRRTGGWRIPVALLVAFAVVFAVSTAITRSAVGGGEESNRPAAPSTLPPGVSPSEHEAHH
jgi:hypothetical protein